MPLKMTIWLNELLRNETALCSSCIVNRCLSFSIQSELLRCQNYHTCGYTLCVTHTQVLCSCYGNKHINYEFWPISWLMLVVVFSRKDGLHVCWTLPPPNPNPFLFPSSALRLCVINVYVFLWHAIFINTPSVSPTGVLWPCEETVGRRGSKSVLREVQRVPAHWLRTIVSSHAFFLQTFCVLLCVRACAYVCFLYLPYCVLPGGQKDSLPSVPKFCNRR